MKKTPRGFWSVQRITLLGAFVFGLFLLSGMGTIAQVPDPKKEDEKAKDTKKVNVVRAGFTRPGNPPDPVGDDGVIRPVANDPALAKLPGKLLGGTVYFMVLEQTGNEGDPWGIGVADFASRFVEGKSFTGGFSQNLDTKAKYIYLYMVVNDRGLEPTKDRISLASDTRDVMDKKVNPISTTALKLIVDPRYITSWGYFKQTGFTVEVPDTFAAEHKPVADNLVTKIRMAVSSNTSFLDQIPEPERRYQDRAPAYSLGKLRNTFTIGASNVNGTKTHLYKALEAKREKASKKGSEIKMMSYEKNLIKSGEKGGNNPDFVQILYSGYDDRIDPETADSNLAGQAVFRADFRGNNLVGLGEQSVLFGFTSDLPPVDVTVRIEDPEAAARGNGIAPVAPKEEEVEVGNDENFVVFMQQGQGAAPGSGVAPGTAPTPSGGGAMGAGSGMGASLGGGAGRGGAGGGGGFGGFPAAGGIGAATPGVIGGGGGGGPSSGNQNQNQPQTQTQTQDQTQKQAQFQFQLQLQLQAQFQRQHQHQHNNHHHNNNVIPAPPAILLGLLGLPALVFFRRRKEEPAAV